MNLVCEACMNEDGEIAPKKFCKDCEDYHQGCHEYKEIYSGKIGMSFLEFISNDFDKIADDLIELFYEVKDNDWDDIYDTVYEYLDQFPVYMKLLGIHGIFRHCINMCNKIPALTPETAIREAFSSLLTIQKIISAYADDKYFVEPDILLQAINEYKVMFCPSTYVPDLGDDYTVFENNPVEAITAFAKECNKTRGNEYEFPVFYHMFGVAFDWIVNSNYRISRCENCGRFFVPYNRYDARYCPYPFKNGKSCRDLSFAINIDNNAVLKEYRKIYKTKHAWMNRNKVNRPSVEDEFTKWHKEAKSMVDKYKLGAISEEECLKWLRDNK